MSKAVKTFIMMLTSDEGRKSLKKIIIVLLSPLLLILILLITLQGATSSHNNEVVDVLFNDKSMSDNIPEEYAAYLNSIKDSFNKIDTKINSLENIEGKMDNVFIKTVLFNIYLLDENTIDTINLDTYLSFFYTQEEREVEIKNEDEDAIPEFETILVTIPIQNTDNILFTLSENYNVDLTSTKDSLYEVYYVALIGSKHGFDDTKPLELILEESYLESENKEYVGGDFISPFDGDWMQVVTSEFGPRKPITLPDGSKTGNYHYGIDLGLSQGTPLLSVNSGKVIAAKHTNGVFGFYVLVDHGGGIFSFYAHLSKINVEENTTIEQGTIIGEVGNTGASTAPHLHLEIIVNRNRVNPRIYLPKKGG